MSHPETRRPHAILFLVLSAAVLGMAGCSADQSPNGGVASLSDLPNKQQSMLKLGDASRDAGDCAAALRFYQLALGKGGNKAEIAAARLGSAECDLAMGHNAAAEQNYLTASTLKPRDPAPHLGLGRVYLIEHQPGRAAGYFDLAIKEGADEAFVWNDKGVALDQLRRHKDAQQAYRQGLANHPTDPALRNNLALSLAMTGDFNGAESMLRQLTAEPGATARTRDNLALVLGLEGNDSAARQVSAADLDGAALDNNGRFYQYARALLTGAPLPSAAAPASQTAAATPMPPPVLVASTRPRRHKVGIANTAPPVVTTPMPLFLPPPAPVPANPSPVAATQTIAAVPSAIPVASSDGQ